MINIQAGLGSSQSAVTSANNSMSSQLTILQGQLGNLDNVNPTATAAQISSSDQSDPDGLRTHVAPAAAQSGAIPARRLSVKDAMYEFAYNDVIEDSHQTLRAREQAAMDRVIGMLRAAQEKGPQSRELIDALFYLRRLWTIFIDDLNDPNNELPAQLRAGIISIGVWMMKEIDRVRGGLTNDLTPMIEINVLIRNGLK